VQRKRSQGESLPGVEGTEDAALFFTPRGAAEKEELDYETKCDLIVVVIGLLGYALWSFIQAAFDLDGEGRAAKGEIAQAASTSRGRDWAVPESLRGAISAFS